MEKFYRISEAAYLLGICNKTIRRWDALGKIKCSRTQGGHRRISVLEIERMLSGIDDNSKTVESGTTAIYCRVSSHEQKKKGDLERQIQFLKEYCDQKQYNVGHIFSDVGSGLNTRRSGLRNLCKLIENKRISRVVLTYSDRLTRFGLDYLDAYFKSHGAKIQIINKDPDCTMQEELVQDLIAIITSFSGKVHGMRSHKNKNKENKKSTK